MILIIVLYISSIATTLFSIYVESKISDQEIRYSTVYWVLPCVFVKISEKDKTGHYNYTEVMGIVARILPEHWHNKDILAHETEHIRQNYRGLLFINEVRSRFDPTFITHQEKEAIEVSGAS